MIFIYLLSFLCVLFMYWFLSGLNLVPSFFLSSVIYGFFISISMYVVRSFFLYFGRYSVRDLFLLPFFLSLVL